MAQNIVKKASPAVSKMLVLDANQAAMTALTSLDPKRISSAKNPKQLANDVDIIVTMLPSSPHVEKVYLGQDGILEGASQNSILIDSSTIDPLVSKKVSETLKKRGVKAPVSGGTLGAQAGTLTFMVGGTKEDFSLTRPVLGLMGKNIVHCGAHGHGQIAKICNNMLLGICMLATSETMNLGLKLGMDPKVLSEIIGTSSGRNWSLDTYNPVPGVMTNVPSSRDYQGGFNIKLMAKDMGLAVGAAEKVGSTVMLGGLTRDVYNVVSKSVGIKDDQKSVEKFEDKDFSVVFKWLNQQK